MGNTGAEKSYFRDLLVFFFSSLNCVFVKSQNLMVVPVYKHDIKNVFIYGIFTQHCLI